MAFPQGHTYWKNRKDVGRKRLYDTPNKLWKACEKYFDWVADNPLLEEKAFGSKDGPDRIDIKKMRPMSKQGLYFFLQINRSTWEAYAKDYGDEFKNVCEDVELVIYMWKFDGASAGLLNASIIQRELGLSEKVEADLTGVLASIDASDDPQKAAQTYLDFVKSGHRLSES